MSLDWVYFAISWILLASPKIGIINLVLQRLFDTDYVFFDIYTLRVRESIGAMVAHLSGLDALVFTDGVGEHVAEVREAVVASLGWLGIELDRTANAQAQADSDVATAASPVRVLVIHTREELMVARETHRVLQAHPA